MHNCALAQQDNSTLNTPHSTLLGFDEFKSQQYDLLADHLRRHIDMDKLYEIMTRSND